MGGRFADARDEVGRAANTDPVANWTPSIAGLDVDFTDASTDADGAVAGWAWDFGDGNTSTLQNPSHTYAGAGTYSVTLTVLDNRNASHEFTDDVTV